ncbi:MAG: 50S ribosomal protein L10 [Methanobacteriota archaeon]
MDQSEVAKWKTTQLNQLQASLDSKRVVGIAFVGGIPGMAIQKMRKDLLGKADIIVVKNTIASLAIQHASKKKPNLESLTPKMEGQTAIITTDMNPFKLYQLLEENKSKMAARGGETAPDDIEIKAGDTPFKPGPIVGELQKAGIPAAIQDGKVVIKKDKLLVKAGDKIPREVAPVLTKLEIFPLTVGMDLRMAYDEGTIFSKEVMAVDPRTYISNVMMAANQALGLAMEMGYVTSFTIQPMVAKAYKSALALSVEAGIMNKESVPFLLARAQAQMLALKAKADAGGK